MAYLATTDYPLAISLEDLTMILAEAASLSGLTSDQVRVRHENLAIAKITSYLQTKYQIGVEFAKDGMADPDTRDLIIVDLTINLMLCSLHKTINPRDIPELREKACESAMKLLTDIRDGKVTPTVIEPVETPSYNTPQLKSQRKFISKPYQDLSLFDDEEEA